MTVVKTHRNARLIFTKDREGDAVRLVDRNTFVGPNERLIYLIAIYDSTTRGAIRSAIWVGRYLGRHLLFNPARLVHTQALNETVKINEPFWD